jgi:hypothetical protein
MKLHTTAIDPKAIDYGSATATAIASFYDTNLRLWTAYAVDANGSQVTAAQYSPDRATAEADAKSTVTNDDTADAKLADEYLALGETAAERLEAAGLVAPTTKPAATKTCTTDGCTNLRIRDNALKCTVHEAEYRAAAKARRLARIEAAERAAADEQARLKAITTRKATRNAS